MIHCPRCAAVFALSEATFCPRCGTRLPERKIAATPVSTAPFEWDNILRNAGPFGLLISTVAEALFHPSRFYRTAVVHSSRLLPAWLYAMIVGGIGLTASWAWMHLIPDGSAVSPLNRLLCGGGAISPSTLATAPVLLSIQLVLTALYVFTMFRLSRLKRCRFTDLLRILCYTETPVLLQVIPLVGPLLSSLLWVYGLLTALHELYEGSRVRMLFHLLVPFAAIIAIFLIVLLSGIIGGIVAGAEMLPDWKFLLDKF